METRPRTMTAITRRVGPRIVDCALTYMGRDSINFEAAAEQHSVYEGTLRELGLDLISLPPEDDMPDSVFVEDTAIVVDEVAVLTQPKLPSRRIETASVAPILEGFRELRRISGEATIEGGDVIQAEKTVYVGRSTRTNEDGIRQLEGFLAPFGYSVVPVDVTGCLHLKTGASWLGPGVILANPVWINTDQFEEMEILEVAPDEGFAANVLRVGDSFIIPANFPKTKRLLEDRGLPVRALEFGELEKAEAGLTCCSLIFAANG